MFLSELHKKCNDGEFDTKLPYPSMEMLRKDPEQAKNFRKAYVEENSKLYELFKVSLRVAIITELGVKVTDAQFDEIFRVAWDKGHLCGYHEVVNECYDLVDVIKLFV